MDGNSISLEEENIDAAKPLLLIFPFCKPFSTPAIQGGLIFFRASTTTLLAYKQEPTGLVLLTKIQRKNGTVLLNGYFFHQYIQQIAADQPVEYYTQIERFENLDIHTGAWTLWKNMCFNKRSVNDPPPNLDLAMYKLIFRINRGQRKFTLTVRSTEPGAVEDRCEMNWKLLTHEKIIAGGIMGVTPYKQDSGMFFSKLYMSHQIKPF